MDRLYLTASRAAIAIFRRSLPRLASTSALMPEIRGLIELLENTVWVGDRPGDPEIVAAARRLFASTLPTDAHQFIPTLCMRPEAVANTWVFQNQHMQWDICPNELVLDVGSGGWPFKRADHLADKYHGETSHRVEDIVRDSRPLFEVDLELLPFTDDSYDFVFCSHVLEHLDNPGRALRELARVGRRGYIEVPTRLSDILFNFTRLPNHHRWHGLVLGGTLVLVEWSDVERRELGNHFFNALQSPYANPFQDFFEANRDLFFCSLEWKGNIPFLLIDKHGRVIDSSMQLLNED
jgi:SAM-dependent methyltransferase